MNDKLPVYEHQYDHSDYQKKKKKLMFPWWFKIVLYVISLMIVSVSFFFITTKSIVIGNQKTTEWIISVACSFFSSLFLTQPIQVFVITFLLVAVFRSYDDSTDIEYDVDDKGGPIHKV